MQQQEWMGCESPDFDFDEDFENSAFSDSLPLAIRDDLMDNGNSDVTSYRAGSSMSTSMSMQPSLEDGGLLCPPTLPLNESVMAYYFYNNDNRNSISTTESIFHSNEFSVLSTDNEDTNIKKDDDNSKSLGSFNDFSTGNHEMEDLMSDVACSSDDVVSSPDSFMYFEESDEQVEREDEEVEERLVCDARVFSSGCSSNNNCTDSTFQEKRRDAENTTNCCLNKIASEGKQITDVSLVKEILKHVNLNVLLRCLRKRKAPQEEKETVAQASIARHNSVHSSTENLHDEAPKPEQKRKKAVAKRRRGISASCGRSCQENDTAQPPTPLHQFCPEVSSCTHVPDFCQDLADLPSFASAQNHSAQEALTPRGRSRHCSLPDRMPTPVTTTATRVQQLQGNHSYLGDHLMSCLDSTPFHCLDSNGNFIRSVHHNQQAASGVQPPQAFDPPIPNQVVVEESGENNCQNPTPVKVVFDRREAEIQEDFHVSPSVSSLPVLCPDSVQNAETSTPNLQTCPAPLEDMDLLAGKSELNHPVPAQINTLNVINASFSQIQTCFVSPPRLAHVSSADMQSLVGQDEVFNLSQSSCVHSLANNKDRAELSFPPSNSVTPAPECTNLCFDNLDPLLSRVPRSDGVFNYHTVVDSDVQVSDNPNLENGSRSQDNTEALNVSHQVPSETAVLFHAMTSFDQYTEWSDQSFSQKSQSTLAQTQTSYEQPSDSSGAKPWSERNWQRNTDANWVDVDTSLFQTTQSGSDHFGNEFALCGQSQSSGNIVSNQPQRSGDFSERASEQKLESLDDARIQKLCVPAPLLKQPREITTTTTTTTTTTAMIKSTKKKISVLEPDHNDFTVKNPQTLEDTSKEKGINETDVPTEENRNIMYSKNVELVSQPGCSNPCFDNLEIHPPMMEAAQQVLKTGKMMPIIKQELKWAILARRHAEGKGDLDVTFEPPLKNQMTEEERSKSKQRKERNKEAAAKCRKKKKAKEEASKQECEMLTSRNAHLRETIKKLEEEKTRIFTSLYKRGIITAFSNNDG